MRTLLPFYGVPKWLSLQHAPQLASLERGELRHASGGYRDATCTAGACRSARTPRRPQAVRVEDVPRDEAPGRALAELVAATGGFVPRQDRESTFARLLEEWLEHTAPSLSPKTVVDGGYVWTVIAPVLGDIPVVKLTPVDLDRFYRRLLEVGSRRVPTRRRQPCRSVAVHEDGAVGVGDAVLADRAEGHPGELAVAAATDDEEVGSC